MPIRKLKPISAKFITGAAMLALMAGMSISMAPTAFAEDCLLDTNNDGNADSNIDTDGGAVSAGDTLRLACGTGASAAGIRTVAIGQSSLAAGVSAIALGDTAQADGFASIAIGFASNFNITGGDFTVALGNYSQAGGVNSIAIGADTFDAGEVGAYAQGADSIVIGTDSSDGAFAGTVVIGSDIDATEADQVILKDAATFTILGNGDVGIGTAAPGANLVIDSGAADTTLHISNTSAQWELKSKASTGRLNFKNLTVGGVPFKLGPNSVNGLLSVGTAAADMVEVRGDLDVTGTLTTGGPTCGGGCDAVFGADYDLPSIEEHAAQMFANSYLPEVGPTVPKAAINVSERMGTMLNELEKAHIYIAQIQAEKRDMQAEFLEKFDQQESRLAKLEGLLNE